MFDVFSYRWDWTPRRSAFESESGLASGEPLTYGETVELARLLRICVKWKAEVMLRKNRCQDFNGLRDCMWELNNPNSRTRGYYYR